MTSKLHPGIGCLHVFYLKDVSQVLRKQVELAIVHQVLFRPSAEEDLPGSVVKSTLRTHLMQTYFARSVFGSVRSEVMQQADPTHFRVDSEFEKTSHVCWNGAGIQ